MTTPCIISVAITGSLPTKRNNPAVPIGIKEQIDSTQEAFEAGATLAHCHVRNDDGTPTSSPERFARLMEGFAKTLPGNNHTAFNRRAIGCGPRARRLIALKPDMASLATGSCNFPTRVYENSPELIDCLP